MPYFVQLGLKDRRGRIVKAENYTFEQLAKLLEHKIAPEIRYLTFSERVKCLFTRHLMFDNAMVTEKTMHVFQNAIDDDLFGLKVKRND
jgi:hypothetical protein